MAATAAKEEIKIRPFWYSDIWALEQGGSKVTRALFRPCARDASMDDDFSDRFRKDT
jgi:hypothetical protein